MDNCPFCKIISGEIPAKKLYEDDSCVAILDIYPANPGHVLLLSKSHHQSYMDILDPDLVNIGVMSKKIGENIIRALKPDGLSLFIADGAAGGQRAPHFILHIIPRVDNDNVPLDAKYQAVQVDSVFEKLKPGLKELFPAMDYDRLSNETAEKSDSNKEEREEHTAIKQAQKIEQKQEIKSQQAPAKQKKEDLDDGITLDNIKDLFG